MKFALLLAAVASVVASSSLYRYGWQQGKESIYLYESHVLSGIPKINQNQFAGVKLVSKVRIQSNSDFSLRIKFEDVHFKTINGEVEVTENGRIIGEGGSQEEQIPQEFKSHLEQPFLVHLKNGVVQSFFVARDEPSAVTNIKRSLLSQLQLDVSGSQRSPLESNRIRSEGVSEEHSFFTTREQSLHGNCNTEYTIHRLPTYRAKELEQLWAMEERQVQGRENEPQTPEGGQSPCEGKKYFHITKTKDLDLCDVRPAFQKWSGMEGNCDISKAECSEVMSDSVSSTVYVCGEISSFHIRKIVSDNVYTVNPMLHATQEQFQTKSQINIQLLKIGPTRNELPLPSNNKEIKSLTYHFLEQEPGQSLSEEVVAESKKLLGVRPVLPQPGLTEPPITVIPIQIHKREIVSQVYQQLKKMSTLVYESPESCGSKDDIAGTWSIIANYMTHLGLSELKELEHKILHESSHGGQQPPIKKLFYDVLSVVGTNPSTMLVMEKVKSRSLPVPILEKMIQYTLLNVKYPTKQLLQKLVEMVKHQTDEQLMASSMVQLSNLFYRAYINPSTMVSNYPTNVYGVFGTKQSPLLTQEYIPFLNERIEQARGQYERLSVVTALGKLGHEEALKTLLKVAEGKYSEDPLMRSLAVYSMKRVAKRNPPQLKPIMLALINNPAEIPEVRMAAISILPWCYPTSSELQSIAMRTWMEPSKQVSSFIASTLSSLAYVEIPELKPLKAIAKPVLSLLKHKNCGVHCSHNLYQDTFIDYLKTTISQQFSDVKSESTIIPSRLSYKTDYYANFGMFKFRPVSFTVYTSGMDSLLEKYRHYFTSLFETTPKVNQQLREITEQLQIQAQQKKSPKMFLQGSILDWESSLYLDPQVISEVLEKASKRVRNGHKYSFDLVNGMRLEEFYKHYICEAGFPFVGVYSKPVIYAVKGYFETVPVEGSLFPEVKGKIIPVFNGKMQGTQGIISPFTNEFIGTGVEMSLHSSIAVEVKAKISRGQLEVTINTPHELETNGKELETIHGFVMPYTVKKNLLSVQPISQSPNLKKILSGKQTTYETSVGESVGINSQLLFESNAPYVDLASYIEKLRQTSLTSWLQVSTFPCSLRYSSTKVKYNPGQSRTKELQIKAAISTKGYKQHWLKNYKPINEQEWEQHGFTSITKTLAKLQGGSATLLEISATLKGQYSGQKEYRSAAVIGSQGQTHGAAIDFKASSQQVYGASYEGQCDGVWPKNRWNIEGLLQEKMQMQCNGKITYGQQSSGEEINVNAKLHKTERQNEAVRESWEYKQCQKKQSVGWKLAPICMKVRRQAASLNKVELEVRAPKSVYKNKWVQVGGAVLESVFLGQISIQKTGGEGQSLKVEAFVNRTGEVGQVKIETPFGNEIKVKNVRLYGYSGFPVSIHNPLLSSVVLMLTKHQLPATCAVEPQKIKTFDGKTFDYKINDCSHLLFKDRYGKVPVAITTRSMPGDKKAVKILSGKFEVEIMPQGSGIPKVVINDQVRSVNKNQEWKEVDSKGYTILQLWRSQDDVYYVYLADQMLTVLTDGQRIEIVAPQMLHGQTAGICGDMNGEKSADIKTPKYCVMEPKLSAVSYILNKEPGSHQCSGIPTELREKYERASHLCPKQHYIPTPLSEMYQSTGTWTKPIISAHHVDKRTGQICISKQMIKVCSSNDESGSMHQSQGGAQRTVQYVCIRRPSSMGESMEKRAKSGQPLELELEQFPVQYTKTVYEPTSC